MANNARKHDSKFSTNWEGPFRILKDVNKGTYRFEMLYGELVLILGMNSFKVLFQLVYYCE